MRGGHRKRKAVDEVIEDDGDEAHKEEEDEQGKPYSFQTGCG